MNTQVEQNFQLMKTRWKNRRLITWLANVVLAIVTLLLFFYTQDPQPYTTLYTTYVTFVAALNAYYFGASTFDDKTYKEQYNAKS